MTSPRLGIPATSWAATVLASAVFGGFFWAVLSLATTFFDATAGGHQRRTAILVAVVVAVIGWLIHLAPSPRMKMLGVAMTLGAALGLPVLGYVALVTG